MCRHLQVLERPCLCHISSTCSGRGKRGYDFLSYSQDHYKNSGRGCFLDILRQQGMNYKVVTITAKEKLCFMEETKCDPAVCPYAKGHFDRVNDAVYELWTKGNLYDRQHILDQAEKWKVCPLKCVLIWLCG